MGRSEPAEPAHRIRGPADFAAAFDVSREALARLGAYEALLRKWQKAVNLVAPATLEEIWHRHFADSAQLLPLAPPGPHHWIDLGSGGGFPGLVIAIMLADDSPSPRAMPSSPLAPSARGEGHGGAVPPARGEAQQQTPSDQASAPHPNPLPMPEGAWGEGTARARCGDGAPETLPRSRVTLIESDARKAAFLREVARQVAIPAGVSVDILSTRAESARIKVNGSLPRVICARALAPLDRLLELAAPLSPPGTTGLYLKGKTVAQELRAAEKMWNFNVELIPSVTDRDGRIAVITRLERKAKD